MARAVSYERQTVGSRNPAKRFAHRSRLRRAAGIADSLLPKSGSLLDFGAGPGTFLQSVHLRRPDARLFGYDKFKSAPGYDGLTYIGAMADLPDQSIDVLTALEVLEHVIEEDMRSFLVDVRRLMRPTGSLVVSVPIMYGPITLVKEASQMISHRRGSEYSLPELSRVLLGQPIPRPPATVSYQTHKGFDFRALRARLSRDFRIEKEICSPFPHLPWIFNSQMFFVAKTR